MKALRSWLVRPSLAVALSIGLTLGLSACATRTTSRGLHLKASPASHYSFFVGKRGWHSSITVERAAIPKGTWPPGVVERTFAGSRYLEVGWGDADFYMARHPTVLTALDAALLPGPSVLLVVGLDPPLETALPWSGLERVTCSRAEFRSLCRAIGATFQRDKNGNAQVVGTGLYGRMSRFYPAHGLYYCLQTCNHWTTQMMVAGGLPASLAPTETASSGAVVAQARRLLRKRAMMRTTSPGSSSER